jgi:hypothetical protein
MLGIGDGTISKEKKGRAAHLAQKGKKLMSAAQAKNLKPLMSTDSSQLLQNSNLKGCISYSTGTSFTGCLDPISNKRFKIMSGFLGMLSYAFTAAVENE